MHAVSSVPPVVEIALQLYDDSQPFVGLRSLSNFPLRQVRAVQVVEEEQDVHVALATAIVLHASQHSEPSLVQVEHTVLDSLALKPLPHST